jgi:hypothetical protein
MLLAVAAKEVNHRLPASGGGLVVQAPVPGPFGGRRPAARALATIMNGKMHNSSVPVKADDGEGRLFGLYEKCVAGR